MATILWDSERFVLVDFLECRKAVTGAYYVQILRKLRVELAKKGLGKPHRGIIFHHDNASAHS